MGQSFDSDRPGRLPPVAPPPRKISTSSLPEMSVFRGLAGNSSPPQGGFGPLPRVTSPPGHASNGHTHDPRATANGGFARTLPHVSPPPRSPLHAAFESSHGTHQGPPPPAAPSRDPLAESITRVNGSPARDTYREPPREEVEELSSNQIEVEESLDWDEEEESTHVFHSSAPPPLGGSSTRGSRVATARGLAPPAKDSVPTNVMQSAPGTDTLRLANLDGPPSSLNGFQPPPHAGFENGAASQNGFGHNLHQTTPPPRMQGTPSSLPPMFPPPPPVPSITQARPMEQMVAGISHPISVVTPLPQAAPQPPSQSAVQAQEVVRDQPFVRLPTGNPHTATELAIKKPTFAGGHYIPPATLGAGELPNATIAPVAERRDPKRWILAVAAAAALLSLAALGSFLYGRRPGGIQVEVQDASGASVPKAEVYLDGRRVCEATPCSVRDIEVGKHSIRVVAPSTNEVIEPVNVEIQAGATTPVTFTLKPQQASLVVATEQPLLRLLVDNVDRGPLPVKLTDLAPGKHELKFVGERFKSYEKTVEIKAGETLDFEVPKLKVIKGRALVRVLTKDVAITVVRTDEASRPKVLEGPFPRAIEVDTSGTWKLVAKKKGLPDFTATLDFPDGEPEKTIDVELTEDKPSETEVASSDKSTDKTPADKHPTDRSSSSRTPAPTPAPTPKPEAPTEPVAAAPPAGNGFLNINSIPASRVLLDGSPLGETPKTGISVSAGTHTVTFIHSELGKKSVSVKVGPGETKTASVRLRD